LSGETRIVARSHTVDQLSQRALINLLATFGIEGADSVLATYLVFDGIAILIGWMGVLAGGYIEWIASPLLFYSWFSALHQQYWQSVGSAVLALALILSFLRRSEGFGYWLWIASAAIMVAAGLVLPARQLPSTKRRAI
jgi:hypothetical protein